MSVGTPERILPTLVRAGQDGYADEDVRHVRVSPRLRQLLKHQLGGVPVESAVYHNWRSLPDNELLAEAERDGFTTDKRMAEKQQHATIVAIDDNSLGGLLAAASSLADAVRSTLPGERPQ